MFKRPLKRRGSFFVQYLSLILIVLCVMCAPVVMQRLTKLVLPDEQKLGLIELTDIFIGQSAVVQVDSLGSLQFALLNHDLEAVINVPILADFRLAWARAIAIADALENQGIDGKYFRVRLMRISAGEPKPEWDVQVRLVRPAPEFQAGV